jgi:hypothetical protein
MGSLKELSIPAPDTVRGPEPQNPAAQRPGLVDSVKRNFLPQQGEVLGGHDKQPTVNGEVHVFGGLRPVRSRLATLGVSSLDLDKVFNNKGEIPGQASSRIEVFSYPLHELPVVDGWLRGRLSPVYDLVDPSLSERRPGGTNLHGTPHADAVTESTVNLLTEA